MSRYIVICVAFVALMSPLRGNGQQAAGVVTGVVTWQYNQFIGTKGDVNAIVIMLPVPLRRPLPPQDAKALGLGIVEPGSTAQHDGILLQNADGYGNVEFDEVHPGDYDVIVISAKTFTDNSNISDEDEALFHQYFSSYYATQQFLGGLIKVHKWTYLSVHVTRGGKAHFSHDFGYTDI